MEQLQVKKAIKRKRHRARKKEKIAIDQSAIMEHRPEKTKEQILAERQAKKAAKKQQNKGSAEKSPSTPLKPIQSPTSVEKLTPEEISSSAKPGSPLKVSSSKTPTVAEMVLTETPEKTREQIMAERKANKLAKQSGKKKSNDTNQKTEIPQQQSESKEQPEQKREVTKINSDIDLAKKMENLHISESAVEQSRTRQVPQTQEKGKATSKAERRAIQEEQRAAKVKAQQEKNNAKVAPKTPAKIEAKSKETKMVSQTPQHAKTPSIGAHKVKQFKHLYTEKCNLNINVNGRLHPAILKLGVQYANDTIVGSNARCYAFLNALKTLINDYETPEEKVFSRGLESEIQLAVEFLQKCRPLAVSMTNALKHIKLLISQETSTDSDLNKKQRIMSKIDTYAHEQIETAAIAISLKVREKISNDDVILTFGCSSLIKRSLVEAWKDGEKRFSVIVVDSRPDHEGQEMLKSLTMEGISCTYVLINAISFIMPKVTKVLLGAHALLANGYVMSRVGTAQISMVADYFNVPVLICCETHKFSERVQTDSFVYNELGDPNALARNKNSKTNFEYLKDWESIPHLTPLNLRYDITPPELITAVVTEVALLPCTSVQVILRVKPAE